MINQEISLRSIQHYLYCPHRWGLLEVDRAWAENLFVTKANLLHNRVHDPDRRYTLRGKKVFTSVKIYHDAETYNLFGVADCIEAEEDKAGISVLDDGKKYRLCIVEYKPTKPKGREYNEDDLMQVFAQKICVDYVFGCDCTGVLYYADIKKRIDLPLKENYQKYDEKLKQILKEMRENREKGIIPPIQKGQKCSGCSMKDLCMPSLKRIPNLHEQIKQIGEEKV